MKYQTIKIGGKDKMINLNKTDILLRIGGSWFLRTFRPITFEEAKALYWFNKEDKERNRLIKQEKKQ